MVEDDRDIDIETDGDGDDEVNGRVRRNRMGVSKRYHHNELERKRRDHIKDSFSLLRDVIPAVAGEKISRALILNKASEFIKEMKIKNQQHEEEIETLRQSNFILEEQVKLLQKSRSSGSTESAEKILQSLSGQISEKMKNYNASRPTWEEKNAQIASRLQNSILTQNLSVKSAQNFMDKFVNKQGPNNMPSPSSLIEPSSYYAAPDMSPVESQPSPDDDSVASSSGIPANIPSSTMTAKPIKANLAGKVVASPIVSGSGAKVPRGVVTATPVTAQTSTTAQQTPPQQQQNPTAINLANALKALAAQSLRVQQLKKTQGESVSLTPPTVVTNKKLAPSDKTPIATSQQVPVPIATAEISTTPISTASSPVTNAQQPIELPVSSKVPLPSPVEVDKLLPPAPTSLPISVQQLAASTSNVVTQESADSTVSESNAQVSLNAILGTNLSPEAERLLNALITSLQPQSGGVQQQQQPSSPSTVPATSVVPSVAPSFSNSVSSQATPQYAPFPSSGTRVAMTAQDSGHDHFIEQQTAQLLQTSDMGSDPLSDSGDLSHLCDLDAFTTDSSVTDNKRPLELSDSLFTGSSLKRQRMGSDF